jgi:hypothetical protein
VILHVYLLKYVIHLENVLIHKIICWYIFSNIEKMILYKNTEKLLLISTMSSNNNSFVILSETSTINSVFQDEFEGFNIGKKIGQGQNGCIYEGTANGYETFVIKTQSFRAVSFKDLEKNINQMANEIGIMMYLQDLDLSPEVYSYKFLYSEKKKRILFVIIMEKLAMVDDLFTQNEATLEDMSIAAIEVLDKMIDVGIAHRDLKWNNLGYRDIDGQMMLVPFDFGMSHHIQAGGKTEIYKKMDLTKLLHDTTCVYDDLIRKSLKLNSVDSDSKRESLHQDWRKSVDILSFPDIRSETSESPNVLPFIDHLDRKYRNYHLYTEKNISNMNTCWCEC